MMRTATIFILVLTPALARADVVLVQDGKAQARIVVAPAVMDAKDNSATLKGKEREAETQRQRLRESVKDLALYLEKMSGAKIDIVTQPQQGDKRLAIIIGEPAVKAFGPAKKSAPFQQGFRVAVAKDSIVLLGESDLATSYAVYEVLNRLGCRWYMPSDMGEVIPKLTTVALPEMDISSSPGTIYRGIWYA